MARNAVCGQKATFREDDFSGTGAADQELVADEVAAAPGENQWSIGQARALLLAFLGGEPSHTASVWEHAAQDRGPAVTSRIDAP